MDWKNGFRRDSGLSISFTITAIDIDTPLMEKSIALYRVVILTDCY